MSRFELIKLKVRVHKIINAIKGKETITLVGSRKAYLWQALSPALRYNYCQFNYKPNMLMDLGKDAAMKRLGNLTGQGYIISIGTGDSTAAVNSAQTDLQAAVNKAWKTVTPSTDINYVRPTLFIQVNFGFTENNWTWNELGLRDNNNVMWARQVDGTPIIKTNLFGATVEWQLQLS